jgi:hypothetical protein
VTFDARKHAMVRSLVKMAWLMMIGMFLCVGAQASPAPAQAPASSPRAMFDFHSGFWVNLHHFLYMQAIPELPKKDLWPKLLSSAAMTPADTQALAQLSPMERTAWQSAIDYYARELATRELLDDEGLHKINTQLGAAESSVDLAGADIPAPLKATLLKVAPIYRHYFWSRHDAANRHWQAELQPLLERHAASMRSALERIYETPWSSHPVRVELSVYASWAGAYTWDFVTISTVDPRDQGLSAFELLFHESSHLMSDKMEQTIDDDTKALSAGDPAKAARVPRDLWHAVVFYTAGALTAERFPGYVPYADRNNLWGKRGPWPGPVHGLIEQDWGPYIRGTVGFEPALTKLVSDSMAAEPGR